jgi:hypothetical protein
MHVFEVRPRKDHRGADLISDALPFGRLWYGELNAVSNAIDYAKFRSRSDDAVIRVYDAAGNVIETHEVLLVRHAAPHAEIAFATIKGNAAGADPAAYPRNSAL